MSQPMPLPLTVSCFSKIQIGFTFLVPAHPGNPRQSAVKQVCVLTLGEVARKSIVGTFFNQRVYHGTVINTFKHSSWCSENCTITATKSRYCFHLKCVHVMVNSRTICYGQRTTCLVREDKVCPPSLSKRPTKLATKQALIFTVTTYKSICML